MMKSLYVFTVVLSMVVASLLGACAELKKRQKGTINFISKKFDPSLPNSSDQENSENSGKDPSEPSECDVPLPEGPFDIKTPFPPELATTTVAGAKCYYEKRRAHTISYLINKFRGKKPNNEKSDNRSSFNKFISWAIPGLLSGDPEVIAEIDEVLTDSQAKSWEYGSSFDLNFANIVCGRTADYDFVAFNIAAIGILGQISTPPLSSGAMDKIKSWLPEYGPAPKGHKLTFKMQGAICDPLNLNFPETENHIIMTQVARYLTNQMLDGENLPEFDVWMVEHMEIFLANYFDEYNSRPYQTYALQPILVLGMLAKSKAVRDKARDVLQMVMAVQASQSQGYRRLPPFRRQPQYKDVSQVFDGDKSMAPLAYFSGYFAPLHRYKGEGMPKFDPTRGDPLLVTGVLYETAFLSNVVLDLLVSENSMTYSQRYNYHGNSEVYAKSPSFLISAAGKFHKYEKCPETTLPIIDRCLTDQQHGFATKTLVIPAASESTSVKDFLRFQGHPKVEKRFNTCVAPGFLCGIDPKVPEAYMNCPLETQGAFTFLDLNQPEGPCALGFYVAVRDDPCGGDCPDGVKSIGFMHLLDQPSVSLAEFKEKVVLQNPGPVSWGKATDFVGYDGQRITFTVRGKGGASFVAREDIKSWASGDIIRIDNKVMKISSPNLKKTLKIPFK